MSKTLPATKTEREVDAKIADWHRRVHAQIDAVDLAEATDNELARHWGAAKTTSYKAGMARLWVEMEARGFHTAKGQLFYPGERGPAFVHFIPLEDQR